MSAEADSELRADEVQESANVGQLEGEEKVTYYSS
jgi:hypothetical protein